MPSYEFVTASGTIVVDTSLTEIEVQDEFKALFGADLIIDPASPEGLLIEAETQSRDGIAKNNATLANQINPNIAAGIFLDALFKLFGGERDAEEKSTFSVAPTITGVGGTFIAAGAKAQNAVTGAEYETVSDVTIDVSGTDTVQFQAVEAGALQVGIGDLSIIVTNILGWETVTNTVVATPGRLEESDQAGRIRREETLAEQSISVSEAIISAVRNVDNVTSLSYRENVTPAPLLVDGVLLNANSTFVCVAGGTDVDIANALLKNKTPGGDWTGTTVVATIDPVSGQSYDVRLERPTDIPILVEVTVSVGTSLADPIIACQDAVIKYAAGLIEGELGFVVSADVSPFELGGAVNQENPGFFVRQVLVDTVAGASPSTSIIPIGINQQASVIRANITVTVV